MLGASIGVSAPLRVAHLSTRVTRPDPEALAPVFADLLPRVYRYLDTQGAEPGMTVAQYLQDSEGLFTVRVGIDIGSQPLRTAEGVTVMSLPATTVARIEHRGPVSSIPNAYEQLELWMRAAGYVGLAESRELYRTWNAAHPECNLTEIERAVGH